MFIKKIFGKIFGQKDELPTAPPRTDGDERDIELSKKQRAQLRKKAAPKLEGNAGDGRYTRKSRDRRPPALRYQERFDRSRGFEFEER